MAEKFPGKTKAVGLTTRNSESIAGGHIHSGAAGKRSLLLTAGYPAPIRKKAIAGTFALDRMAIHSAHHAFGFRLD